MQGTFTTRGPDGQPLELPFDLKRTGAAKIEAAPKNAAVSKELEGTWSGTMEVDGTSRELGLRFRNQADGTASGIVIAGEGTEIAITTIAQKASAVTLDVKSIGGSYTGTLDASGTELTGTWTQGPFTAPLVFRRTK